MWISDFAIRRPVITTVVVLALVVFGLIALVSLDTDEFPEVQPPVINVAVAYPGASPENVESEVVVPLEEAFSSISGVDEMTSRAFDGYGMVTVTFLFDKDLEQASQDIRDEISEIRDELPPEIEEPVITRFDPNELPIVSLTLVSDTVPPAELTWLADEVIGGELRSVPGVATVDVVGGVEREMTIELSPRAMQAANVGVAEVVAALEAENLAAPVGRVEADWDERTIRLRGRLVTPEDFEAIVVGRSGGRVVRLGDVADAEIGAEEPRSGAMFDGRPAVGVDVVKSIGYSTTAVADQVLVEVDDLRRTLPANVRIEVVRNAGERVSRSVSDVRTHLFEGALLTVAVVLLFLRSWRSTVITGLALPVSMLASFIAVWAFGFTLNTMSLLGLTLAIGILVDDAIVVRENIIRHMEMGKDHTTAAREGTAEIGLAVAATTFSIVVVFVPIAFMGGIAEQWFAPFALTIACAVLVSLFVSFSLDPMLSAHWPDPEATGERPSWLSRRLGRFNAWFDRQTGRYERLIAWALRHPIAMVLIAVVSFAAALAMPALGILGSEFLPEEDRSEFSIRLETPPGSSLDYTEQKARVASGIAREHPAVAYTYTTVGGEGGAVDEATIYVRLVPSSERDVGQTELAEHIRDEVSRVAGTTAYVLTSLFGAEKEIQVQIAGPDLDTLNQLADRVRREVERVPGAVDVGLSTRGQKPELEVVVDRNTASRLGLGVSDVAQALRPAFAGIDAGDWVDPTGETRDVEVRLAPEARRRAEDVESIPLTVPGPDGTVVVELGQIAEVKAGLGPAQIEHLDRERVITVGANTEGAPLSEVVQGIEQRLRALELPPGYEITQGGETENQREVFGRILTALAVAVGLMYFILVIQFGSFLDPIPIMASLPLSLIGVMLALLVTGTTLNLMSMIGVILLMGIVAKNAILLIDFAKWAHEEGVERQTAIVRAGGTRLRPILMTSLAIIAGMLPVAIGGGEGGDFRAPLGRAVIGGVITSTLLTLLVIPTFWDILARWRERALARLRRRRAEAEAGASLPGRSAAEAEP